MTELTPAHESDEHIHKLLNEASHLLLRAFSAGASVRSLPQTLKALKQLQATIDKEEAVEVAVSISERMQQQDEPTATGKSVAVMLDGSANSLAALKWAVETVLEPEDALYLITVVPFEDFSSDAQRILQEGYDYAHNAGVKASHVHQRSLAAKAGSTTGGVGEALVEYIDGERMSLVVLGSRGMGSIKSSLLSRIGMGSVSEFCMRRLKCPIIMIKHEEDGSAQIVG